ncbi:MAG: hypothetical protein LBR87_03865 [Synergistaceae bacterium]|jgi:hypothetical protein|nr:hypothetical protein [Synergistaceae bacterium]
MPFDSSYIDGESFTLPDSQDKLAEIARRIVREPVATHIAKSRTPDGKIRFLVIDRSVEPKEGSLVVVRTKNGLRTGRLKKPVQPGLIFGTVTWFVQQG